MSLYESDPAVPPLRIRSWRSVRAAWRRGDLDNQDVSFFTDQSALLRHPSRP